MKAAVVFPELQEHTDRRPSHRPRCGRPGMGQRLIYRPAAAEPARDLRQDRGVLERGGHSGLRG